MLAINSLTICSRATVINILQISSNVPATDIKQMRLEREGKVRYSYLFPLQSHRAENNTVSRMYHMPTFVYKKENIFPLKQAYMELISFSCFQKILSELKISNI